jgi:hypothetical protein
MRVNPLKFMLLYVIYNFLQVYKYIFKVLKHRSEDAWNIRSKCIRYGIIVYFKLISQEKEMLLNGLKLKKNLNFTYLR